MDLKLQRIDFFADGIFGELREFDGTKVCSTLEHAYDSGNGDGSFAPKIPAGSYTCVRRLSPKFKYELFELQNVPGHDAIEIHLGNYNDDSHGCILLGLDQVKLGRFNMLQRSRAAFQKFMDLQKGVDSFTLTIT